jgi:hypothetical protein
MIMRVAMNVRLKIIDLVSGRVGDKIAGGFHREPKFGVAIFGKSEMNAAQIY